MLFTAEVATPMPSTIRKQDLASEGSRWLSLVEQLLRQIERWCRDRGWAVHREQAEVTEAKLGTYRVPVLSIRSPAGHVYVEPVARYVAGADGRVDIYAFPSMTRMLLARVGDKW